MAVADTDEGDTRDVPILPSEPAPSEPETESLPGPPQQPAPQIPAVPAPPVLTDEEALAAFPVAKLTKLDELISNPRWVIPVLPGGELEVLLDAAIDLSRRGIDTQSEPCQRFYREGLTTSFTKIMTDEAVSTWRFDIHECIRKNSEKLLELICTKLQGDWFPLLDLLPMVFNPGNKFHLYNSSRASETCPSSQSTDDVDVFAQSTNPRTTKGWLVDLLNTFGKHGGFKKLHDRILSGETLTIPLIFSLIRPFGLCYEFLTVRTVTTYFLPVIDAVPKFLENLTDEELKKESKNENKYDTISAVVKSLKHLCSLVPGREESVRSLEMFRLKMLLRQLQISSFSGKMSALNEVNKVIHSVHYTPGRYNTHNSENEDWLTADRMAAWIKENNLIKIVLRDSLHQPQYVEKLEKIIRFIIKEKALTMSDLDDIWAAQAGKHEAIVKNIHELLAKLAWDFSPDQLDHLFECFQASWKGAASKQREKLLELIRRLAEDDKDGDMAEKVLKLFWSLAHSTDVTTDIMDQALTAHVKILDYSCTQNRDEQKSRWLDKCVEELKANEQWVLPALKQIKDICTLYQEQPPTGTQRTPGPVLTYRHDVINGLQRTHTLVILIADNLTEYMDRIRSMGDAAATLDPNEFAPDGRYCHSLQVSERLNFLRFLLRDGQLWLCAPQAKQIWTCLAENAIFPSDREQCFKWFSKLMGDEPDLDPEINKDFFESNLLQLDPGLLTEAGMKCLERFFKTVNIKEGRLVAKRRSCLMENIELIGLDYLWKVITKSPEEVSNKAIELMKETFTNLGPRLQAQQTVIHEDFIAHCMDILKSAYDTITVIKKQKEKKEIEDLTLKICRTMKVLHEYISECDYYYLEERTLLPLYRAARGKQILLTIRYNNPGRQIEDLELYMHDKETLASLRRTVFSKLKANPCSLKLELALGQDQLESADDRKILEKLGIKDKTIITAKLSQVGSGAGASSPDSSSDSSSGSPQHNMYDGPNVEAEACLPGVILSSQGNHSTFFCDLSDLGSCIPDPVLRDSAQALLKLLPPEVEVIRRIKHKCAEAQQKEKCNIESYFSSSSPALTLYQLEVCHALLLPAGGEQDVLGDGTFKVQLALILGGAVKCFLNMLISDSLTAVDPVIRLQTYLVLLKINKFLLLVVAHSLLYMVVDAQSPDSGIKVSTATHNHAVMLQQGIQAAIPCPGEGHVRQVALRLGQTLLQKGAGDLPGMPHVRCVYRLAWAAAAGDLTLQSATPEKLRAAVLAVENLSPDLICLAREAMEVLTLTIALHPEALEQLVKDKVGQAFVLDLVLLCRDRSIRQAASEQFLMMTTRATGETHYVKFMITLLFTVINSIVSEHPEQSSEYFNLISRLLAYLASNRTTLNNVQALLSQEVDLLSKTRVKVEETGEPGISNTLLEGHLAITRELVMFLPPDKKQEVGATKIGGGLVKELVEDWIFPASKLWVVYSQTGNLPTDKTAVCQTPATTSAAFELLVALCSGCSGNLSLLATMLADMFYNRVECLTEWDYLPPVGPRPQGGFVGLKNAGATCYMNSVLQQLFMLEGIKRGILDAEGTCKDPNEDFSAEDRNEDDGPEEEGDRNDYNVTILKQIQAIFGHLSETQLQYYIPKGLWKHFRMLGEPVNLREQQDAVEFFMTLIETLDEALKHVGHPQVCSSVLGGIISDQKICKTCPHRYSRQEPCSVISVDVKNHSNLMDSLAEYTKGELLETENAYYCEQCNKKVDTVKRLCVKKLPPILVIQLKRFDYDFERETAVKFNDYFEFPRELDMEPYTVAGLARRENEAVDCGPEDLDPGVVRTYVLRGMVVHSGQASGGHYYSYIRQGSKWYKFDDGDVTEVFMQDDEELKNQCWGGEYLSEVFDHVLKRMSVRRQKRWWNAYMLFYCRSDLDNPVDIINTGIQGMRLTNKMPGPIEKSIVKQNVLFLHNRNQFSPEYFNFMKKLISCNTGFVTPASGEQLSKEQEDICLTTVQLASAFLFSIGFHTKKSIRGNSMDWYEILSIHLRYSRAARSWFCNNILFSTPARFAEYLLECPSPEVRLTFSKLLVFCAHFSAPDGPVATPACLNQIQTEIPPGAGLSEHILLAVLSLLWAEVADYGRHLSQYFGLFVMYCSLGEHEKLQLLNLNVPALFMQVALDDGPGPPIKYQYPELGKLYQVVSNLVRCCDASSVTQSAVEGVEPAPNPYLEPSLQHGYLAPIQIPVSEHLFQRSAYLKKLIEDANSSEDTKKLLQFCCWENPHFSHTVLYELLWQIAFAYTYELRPFLQLLLGMLLMEDSWQTHRIMKALKGIPDDHSARDGLFDTIQRCKNHYQKRAYQCIKMLVTLFSQCQAAKNILQANGDLKKKWTWSVEWLHEELERVGTQRAPYSNTSGSGYYSNWSPPAGSNETANGYFLERSQSARLTLEKAFELLPDEDEEEGDEGVGVAAGPAGEEDGGKKGQNSAVQRPPDR